jgi:prepilin-type N-terminal cleavage/methylation domain-containing protein
MKKHCQNRPAAGGFTLIEVLVVIGIIGIMMLASYPSIMNTLAARDLDNTTREIQTYLQQAKHRAVSTKIIHRVRFFQVDGSYWAYEIEALQPGGVSFARVPGPPRKTISNRLRVTFSLPSVGSGYAIDFSPVGTIANFLKTGSYAIVLQSPKLDRPGQMDERVLSVYMGGSIYYAKRKSA